MKARCRGSGREIRLEFPEAHRYDGRKRPHVDLSIEWILKVSRKSFYQEGGKEGKVGALVSLSSLCHGGLDKRIGRNKSFCCLTDRC